MPVRSPALVSIATLVAVVYWPVIGHGFLEWDDDLYVTANPLVLSGLTLRGIAEAFTSFGCSNWHPLTLRWPESLMVAAIFAAHPQRVESVAWISEALAPSCARIVSTAVPLGARFANAVVGYATYVLRTVWPTDLAALYPLAVSPADATNVGGMPWLAFGWAWFLVMLVPVIGLVQVGSQATADRYYYLPGIGLEFGVVVTAGEALRRFVAGRESLRRPCAVAAGGAAEAVEHYRAALQIDPALRDSLTNLGLILSDGGRPAEALPLLERASLLWPEDTDMRVNLAICLARLRRMHDARTAFLRALDIEPDNAKHRYNFAMLLLSAGDPTAALTPAARD